MKQVKLTTKKKEDLKKMYCLKPSHCARQINLDTTNDKVYIYDWAEGIKNNTKIKGHYLYEIENRKDAETYFANSNRWQEQDNQEPTKTFLQATLDSLQQKGWID